MTEGKAKNPTSGLPIAEYERVADAVVCAVDERR